MSTKTKAAQQSRFNFLRQAQIWYDVAERVLRDGFANVIVPSDGLHQEITARPIPTDLEAGQGSSHRHGGDGSAHVADVPLLRSERAGIDSSLWGIEEEAGRGKTMSDSSLVKYRRLNQGLVRRNGDSCAPMQKALAKLWERGIAIPGPETARIEEPVCGAPGEVVDVRRGCSIRDKPYVARHVRSSDGHFHHTQTIQVAQMVWKGKYPQNTSVLLVPSADVEEESCPWWGGHGRGAPSETRRAEVCRGKDRRPEVSSLWSKLPRRRPDSGEPEPLDGLAAISIPSAHAITRQGDDLATAERRYSDAGRFPCGGPAAIRTRTRRVQHERQRILGSDRVSSSAGEILSDR
jgi:hypothetical protein